MRCQTEARSHINPGKSKGVDQSSPDPHISCWKKLALATTIGTHHPCGCLSRPEAPRFAKAVSPAGKRNAAAHRVGPYRCEFTRPFGRSGKRPASYSRRVQAAVVGFDDALTAVCTPFSKATG